MALDRPLSGRIFSGQLIRDNPGIGRPDKVNIVFGRTIRQRGKNRTPGTFRTQVITSGTCPCLYLFYRKTQDWQYLKEGRALRTETTCCQPRDLGIGKELTNLAAMAKAGYARQPRLPGRRMHQPRPSRRSRRPGDAHQPGHQHHLHPRSRHALPRPPRPGAPFGLLRARAPARRLHQPRPAAPPRPPAGKRSRGHVRRPDQLGLRRLRDCQIIERIPHSRSYQLTPGGLSTALFFTRLTRRVIIPALAELTGASPPPGSPLRQADRACKTAIADLAAQASLGIQPRSVTKRRSRQAPAATHNPS